MVLTNWFEHWFGTEYVTSNFTSQGTLDKIRYTLFNFNELNMVNAQQKYGMWLKKLMENPEEHKQEKYHFNWGSTSLTNINKC